MHEIKSAMLAQATCPAAVSAQTQCLNAEKVSGSPDAHNAGTGPQASGKLKRHASSPSPEHTCERAAACAFLGAAAGSLLKAALFFGHKFCVARSMWQRALRPADV